MSWADDQIAEIESQLDRARDKCAYGRKYSPAYQPADYIKFIRTLLSEDSGKTADAAYKLVQLWPKIDDQWSDAVNEGKIDPGDYVRLRLFLQVAWGLLVGAVCSSKKLRKVADALDAQLRTDPAQANILQAYEDCASYPPTLSEVKKAFVKRFDKACTRSNSSIRKTLRMLGLLLSEDKRGRPVGSQSVIGNPKR